MKTKPLLSVGTFGTHLLDNPASTFSFVGEVPGDLVGKRYATYDEGFTAFIDWFKSMEVSEQREHAGNLRNDAFVAVMEA